MVLVAAVALGSSTYAWFASNRQVTGTGMSIRVSGSDFELAAAGTVDNTGKYDSKMTDSTEGVAETIGEFICDYRRRPYFHFLGDYTGQPYGKQKWVTCRH